jgi:nitrogen regulatory protein PII
MQLITAVIRPFKAAEVCDALQRFGFRGLTVTEAAGLGKGHDPPEVYRGTKYAMDFQQHAKIEMVARDADVHDLIEVIRKVAATGRPGDGKVWVTPVLHLTRIRTSEVGIDAL